MAAPSASRRRNRACPVGDMLVRGFLAGVFLAYATSLAQLIRAHGLPPFVGALVLPFGFVILVLLGMELVTGNFALLPMGLMARRLHLTGLLRNWVWVFVANLIGGVFYAGLLFAVLTQFGATSGDAPGEQVRELAVRKTLRYANLGLPGWGLALVSDILCNWMVTVGTLMAFVSRSAIEKMAAMWLPIMIFFALG